MAERLALAIHRDRIIFSLIFPEPYGNLDLWRVLPLAPLAWERVENGIAIFLSRSRASAGDWPKASRRVRVLTSEV
jgi:hypothetical protein